MGHRYDYNDSRSRYDSSEFRAVYHDVSNAVNGKSLEHHSSIAELRENYYKFGGDDVMIEKIFVIAKNRKEALAKIYDALSIEPPPPPATAEIMPIEVALRDALDEVRQDGYEAFEYHCSGIYNTYGEEVAKLFKNLCKEEELI